MQSNLDDHTVLETGFESGLVDSKFKLAVDNAVASYDPANKAYSAILNSDGNASTLTQDRISTLGENAQNTLDNIREINKIARKYVNTNDLIGMVMQSIENNINTGYRLSYKTVGEQKKKQKTLTEAKRIIDDFNEDVNIQQFINDAIVMGYMEGNYPCVLRNKNERWVIDYYPLSIIENSGYEVNGNPVLWVNIDNLKTALSKTMQKKKNGTPLMFKNTDEEVQNAYPDEVYEAYTGKEKYAVLDETYTGMVRVNNYKGKYGLTPIFRALSPALVLEDYQVADASNAKAKAKKIIHQKLRKECMGTEYKLKAYEDMTYAHSQLMSAWKNKTVVITSTPCVESITYVEPKTADTPVDNINIYRNKVLSSLGVAFLAADKSQTANTAKINLSQLLRCINSISEQVEHIIKHFYLAVLAANGIEQEYCPNIKVIDSEMLEMSVRMELSQMLFATFGSSRETALGMLGLDLEDEKSKREAENTDGLDTIFAPRATSNTTSGNTTETTGRPSDKDSNNPDKQEEDKNNRAKDS